MASSSWALRAELLFLLFGVICSVVRGGGADTELLEFGRRRLQQQQQQPPGSAFANPSLQNAYIALQAWRKRITADPQGITATWVGFDVCSYRGVFCSPAPDDSCKQVVSGIDLNHGFLSGTLPEELGLLTYLALFHINTNFFCGTLPDSFAALVFLYELDVSNNRFSGGFPLVTLALPSLAYLDIRHNSFEGELPAALFEKHLDAIFVNNNNFRSQLPWNLGSSPVSVVNFANNFFDGGIPSSIGNMRNTLNEIIFLHNKLDGCIPEEVGFLNQLTVFDVSFNTLGGLLPESMSNMFSLEQLDVASNLLTGKIPAGICDLPNLQNLTISNNFFTGESPDCLALPSRGKILDDRGNCIPNKAAQRPFPQCQAFLSQEPSCFPLPPKAFFPNPHPVPYAHPTAPPPPYY